jgi:hypothetical protein
MKRRGNISPFGRLPFWIPVLAAFFVNLLAQGIHEAGHWSIYTAAGRGPVWGLTGIVQVWGSSPLHPEQWIATTSPDGDSGWLKLASAPTRTEEAVGLAAGPLASLAAAILGLIGQRFGRKPWIRLFGTMLALTISLIMTFYYLRSGLRTGGDEGFLAPLLGIPKIALDLPLGLAFSICLVLAVRELQNSKIRLRCLGAALLGMIPGGLLITLLDPLIRSGVAAGDPAFRPVLGFSLPALLVFVLAGAGTVFVARGVSRLSVPDPAEGLP